jgi:hypothetical protein
VLKSFFQGRENARICPPEKKHWQASIRELARFSHKNMEVKNVMHPFIFWLSTGS